MPVEEKKAKNVKNAVTRLSQSIDALARELEELGTRRDAEIEFLRHLEVEYTEACRRSVLGTAAEDLTSLNSDRTAAEARLCGLTALIQEKESAVSQVAREREAQEVAAAERKKQTEQQTALKEMNLAECKVAELDRALRTAQDELRTFRQKYFFAIQK